MREKPTNPMDDGRTSRYLRRQPSDSRYGLQSYGPAPVSLGQMWLYVAIGIVVLTVVGVGIWWAVREHQASRPAKEEVQSSQPEPKRPELPAPASGAAQRKQDGRR